MPIDIHQHIWTAPLLDALAEREELPFVRRDTDDRLILHSARERAYPIGEQALDPERRRGENAELGIALALIAPSSPIGLETLPRAQSQRLINAHLQGIRDLGEGFAAWGAIPLQGADPAAVQAVLETGAVGVSLPAGALADPSAVSSLLPLLACLEVLEAPLFVHPGPGLDEASGAEAPSAEPSWWRALTDYVAQMQAAWLGFQTLVRAEVPQLVTVFSMLAGGAPLLSERLAARGGPALPTPDPFTFYDTSSYGPMAIDAMAARVGESQLVFGSDRPLAQPVGGERRKRLQANTERVMGPGLRSVTR